VGATIQGNTRESDFVARYGGEEFGVILPETSIQGALAIAERLRQTIAANPVDIAGSQIPVTMSFGIASAPLDIPYSKDELLDKADQVLYEAKRRGKNRCCVFSWENNNKLNSDTFSRRIQVNQNHQIRDGYQTARMQ
jgi:diguanylate cyclase (GGDEF)-like protein